MESFLPGTASLIDSVDSMFYIINNSNSKFYAYTVIN